jgi:hypothetical protein
MKALLEKAFDQEPETVIERIEIHTQFDESKSPSRDDFAAQFRSVILSKVVPVGVRLIIKRWQNCDGGEGLHNRYILTERGGLSFGWGLDEGDPQRTDDITLLADGVYRQRWEQYCGEYPAFDLIDLIEFF